MTSARTPPVPSPEHALVVGKFAPLHRGHQLVLDRALEVAGRLTVVVWANPDFSDMDDEVRAGWLRQLYPQATVVVGADGPPDDAPGPVHWAYVADLLARHGLCPDVVLSSEAYGPPFAAHLGMVHVAVDPGRLAVPVSGTAVRADIHAGRGHLDPRVYRHFVERVVFLGAESTGKTTLAVRMAAELGTAVAHEYGRQHYAERDGQLDLEDYVTIATRHRELEDAASLQADRYVFVDTNAVTTMFFSHYYDRDSLPALRVMAEECRTRYQHVIVCDDDIPFEQDGWRDNATWRARMQGMVLHDLAVRDIPYQLVSGPLDQRVAQVRVFLAGAPPVVLAARRRGFGPRAHG